MIPRRQPLTRLDLLAAALVDVEVGELAVLVPLTAAVSGFAANTPPNGPEAGDTLVFTSLAASL